MAKRELHPSVQQFKEFVREHPDLIKKVRKGETSWQELYEEWYLLGENDPKWDSFKTNNRAAATEEKKEETKFLSLDQILKRLKKMDMNQVQHTMKSLDQTIGTIQGLLSQFQQPEPETQQTNNERRERRPNPFSFRQD